MKLSASLVLYHSDPETFSGAIRSFLSGCEDGVLFVVDNSASPIQHELFSHPRVRYHFAGKNLGFGAAHNVALNRLNGKSEFHLILNPDILFGAEVLPALVKAMDSEPGIGAIMPRIVYPDGDMQRLTKLLPTPVDLILRRFVPFASIRASINRRYELHDLKHQVQADIPSLSGCFLMVRTALLQSLGGFDERFFMYMEDVDLVRRIGSVSRTVYDPAVTVVHGYAKGSYTNLKLLAYHMQSAIRYFCKWGWFFDPVRTERNRRTLSVVRSSIASPDLPDITGTQARSQQDQ